MFKKHIEVDCTNEAPPEECILRLKNIKMISRFKDGTIDGNSIEYIIFDDFESLSCILGVCNRAKDNDTIILHWTNEKVSFTKKRLEKILKLNGALSNCN